MIYLIYGHDLSLTLILSFLSYLWINNWIDCCHDRYPVFRGVSGRVFKVTDLRITCPSSVWVWIPSGTLESFMWGSYPASLWNVGGTTQVPACAWNNARRGTWSLPPQEKLESRHITFAVLVQHKTPKKYPLCRPHLNI